MTDIKNVLLEGLTGLVETFPGVTAGATTATAAFMGMMAISKVITLLKTFQTQLLAIGAGLGPLGIAAAAIGVLVAGFSAYQSHLEKVREEEEKRIQQNREAVQAQQERIDSLEDMIGRYVELQRKQTLSYNEALELKALETQLAEQYGVTKEQVDELAKSTDGYTQSIKDLTQAEREKLLLAQAQQTADAKNAAQSAMRKPLCGSGKSSAQRRMSGSQLLEIAPLTKMTAHGWIWTVSTRSCPDTKRRSPMR